MKLPSGVRLASLGPGMEFGEMAIIEQYRSADVWADAPVICLELPLDSFADYRRLHPQTAMKIMRNLSTLLARRLILCSARTRNGRFRNAACVGPSNFGLALAKF